MVFNFRKLACNGISIYLLQVISSTRTIRVVEVPHGRYDVSSRRVCVKASDGMLPRTIKQNQKKEDGNLDFLFSLGTVISTES
jgi:hypothetical protein